MSRNVAAVAVLVAAPLAAGQSWDFELSSRELSPASPSTTVTLFADVDPSEWLAGALLDVHATEAGWSDLKVVIPPHLAPPSAVSPGEIMGGSVTEILVGQLASFSFQPDPGRIPVWEATFTASDFTERAIELSTETERLDVYLEVWPVPVTETRIPIEGSAAIRVIPAPGGFALLGLGALSATRRRPARETSI